MSPEKFDVAIIGAGVSGAATAWCLAKYELSVALLEKEVDVGFGVSKANSGIVHAGFHHSAAHYLKARLEVKGNLMFEKLHYELGFPFRRNGVLVAAYSYEEMRAVEELYKQGRENGVAGLELCGSERMLELEPKLNPDVVGGLHAPNGGTVEPYRYVFSLVEHAQKNGARLMTDFKVTAAGNTPEGWLVEAADGRRLTARYVVNAAGLYADEVSAMFKAEEFKISPRKGEEYLLDRNSSAYTNHVIFPTPSKVSKGMLVIPTVEGTTMVGPSAEMVEDKENLETSQEVLDRIFAQARHIVPTVSQRDIITAFTGLRPTIEGGDFYIDISGRAPNFIQVAGIESPGLTASPAIGEYVKDLLKKAGLKLYEKTSVVSRLDRPVATRGLSPEELDALWARDHAYCNIVCRCEHVSEAEIVEAVRKGHSTLDGIKFYTRAGMGRCQGGFCSHKIMKIISRETGVPMEEITKRGGGSRILSGKL